MPYHILNLILIPRDKLLTLISEASLKENEGFTENHNWKQCKDEQILGSSTPIYNYVTVPVSTLMDYHKIQSKKIA